MNAETSRLLLVLTALAFFLVAFVLNLTSDQALYNQDLNLVPSWQATPPIDSSSFMSFMNVVSILFDPPVCAAYLALFWLLSSRRLEIMVFLLWFIFMSWVLSVLKSAIHQPRPFWNEGSGIIMESWTCYTEFGCPSGHSWMGLVLMEYLVRFFGRWYPAVGSNIGWFYALVVILECLVMFSRVILGMHTFNEVLMGATIGLFSICLYYLYIEKLIISMLQTILNKKHPQFLKNKTKAQRRSIYLLFLVACTAVFVAVELIVYFAIDYQNQPYWNYIQTIAGCGSVVLQKSFQYRCLQDSAIVMAGVGILFSLILMKDPSVLVRPLAYPRLSLKFLAKFLLFLVLAGLPLAAFLNPGWSKIKLPASSLAVVLWVCQMLGFFLALVMLVLVSPQVHQRCGLEQYEREEYSGLRGARGIQKQLQMSASGLQD